MTRLFSLTLLVGLLVLAGAGSLGLAAPQDWSLGWWTTDSGGGTSTGGAFTLSGTIGQPDAGMLQAGDYRLQGGFWAAGSSGATRYDILLPLVQR